MNFKFIMSGIACCFLASVCLANPHLDHVVSGDATVTNTGSQLQINQTSQKAIIEWRSFNIGAHERTHFQQPAGGITLNRINPSMGMSQIFGSLSATGRIILVNGAGIYLGPSARVNVGGIMLATANIANDKFLAGKYEFDSPSKHGVIINWGRINTADYGLVALLAQHVENRGYIKANLGQIAIGAGNKFTLDFNGDALINFTITEPAKNGTILNLGYATANGGHIWMKAQSVSRVLDNIIFLGGYVQADSVQEHNGVITLTNETGRVVVRGNLTSRSHDDNMSGGWIQLAGNYLSLQGKLDVSGTGNQTLGGRITLTGTNIYLRKRSMINADGTGGGGRIDFGNNYIVKPTPDTELLFVENGSQIYSNGGRITWFAKHVDFDGKLNAAAKMPGGLGSRIMIVGENIHLGPHCLIDASGDIGGGLVQIGGSKHGSGYEPKALFTTLDPGSKVLASALGAGRGGDIVTWAEDTLNMGGELIAKGGPISGNGGFIQMVGKLILNNTGSTDVSAPNGQPGTVTTDPTME